MLYSPLIYALSIKPLKLHKILGILGEPEKIRELQGELNKLEKIGPLAGLT